MKAATAAIALVVLAFLAADTATARPADPAMKAQPAQAPLTFSWSERTLGLGLGGGVSCPTMTFCMVAEEFAGNPLTGRFRNVGGSAATCASPTLCLKRESSTPDFVNSVILASRHPTSRRKRYRPVAKVRQGAYEVTCSSPHFCAASGQNRTAFSRTPGRAGSWRVRGRPGDGGQMLACSAEETCIAVRSADRFVAVIQRPFEPGSRWRNVIPSAKLVTDGSSRPACVGTSSCLSGGIDGYMLSTSHIEAGNSAWIRTRAYAPSERGRKGIGDAACPSPTLCVAMAFVTERNPYRVVRRDLLYSTNPFSGSPEDWHWTPIPLRDPDASPSWVDCPSAEMCVLQVDKYVKRRDKDRISALTVRIAGVGAVPAG